MNVFSVCWYKMYSVQNYVSSQLYLAKASSTNTCTWSSTVMLVVAAATKLLQKSEVSQFQVQAEFGFWRLQCHGLGNCAMENYQPLIECYCCEWGWLKPPKKYLMEEKKIGSWGIWYSGGILGSPSIWNLILTNITWLTYPVFSYWMFIMPSCCFWQNQECISFNRHRDVINAWCDSINRNQANKKHREYSITEAKL